MGKTVVVRLDKDLVDKLWILAADMIKEKKRKVSLSEVIRALLKVEG